MEEGSCEWRKIVEGDKEEQRKGGGGKSFVIRTKTNIMTMIKLWQNSQNQRERGRKMEETLRGGRNVE